MANHFVPLHGVDEHDLAHAALLSSLADETPEGRSIVALANERYRFAETKDARATFIIKLIDLVLVVPHLTL